MRDARKNSRRGLDYRELVAPEFHGKYATLWPEVNRLTGIRARSRYAYVDMVGNIQWIPPGGEVPLWRKCIVDGT